MTLSQIAQETRISLRHLQNLEAGRFKDLPGGIYNRAFLRAYCEILNLDPQTYLSRYEEEFRSSAERAPRTGPIVTRRTTAARSIPPVLPWTALLLLSAAGLYFGKGWVSSVFSPYFSGPPGKTISASHSGSDSPVEKPELADSGAIESAGSSTPTPSAPTQAGDAPDGPAPLPPVPGTIRLEFKVIEQCWVSVSSDGNSVLVKLLEPGDDQSFDALERFYVILGNAGGVRARINGRPAKPFGRPGEVVRVLINEQNIEDLFEHKSAG